jgi:hypothetical protein
MPITFLLNKNDGYFISRYIGILLDEELIDAYEKWFQGDAWSPGLNELVDLSEADLSRITTSGVTKFVAYNEKVNRNNNITSIKIAVYAPRDLHYGLARMYSILADDSPEDVHVFRDIQDAESWLKSAAT